MNAAEDVFDHVNKALPPIHMHLAVFYSSFTRAVLLHFTCAAGHIEFTACAKNGSAAGGFEPGGNQARQARPEEKSLSA